MPSKKTPWTAYPDEDQREKLRKLSEALHKTQSQVLLALVDEKFKALFG